MIGEFFAMNGQRLWEEISWEQRGQKGMMRYSFQATVNISSPTLALM
jgi:hypothetical protein